MHIDQTKIQQFLTLYAICDPLVAWVVAQTPTKWDDEKLVEFKEFMGAIQSANLASPDFAATIDHLMRLFVGGDPVLIAEAKDVLADLRAKGGVP